MLSRFTACRLIGGRQLTNMPYTELMLTDVRRSLTCVVVARWYCSGVVWRRSPAPRMAGVDDIVGVSVDGVAAGTGASASAAFTIARPGRHSRQTPVT